MGRKTILILGAGEFMVPAIMTAKDMGFTVVSIDMNPESVGFRYADYHEAVNITDIQGTIQIAKKYRVDGVVPLNDFGTITAARICEELGFIGISPEVAARCTDKRLMREKWHSDGIPCPEFRIVDTLSAAKEASESIGFPIIIKPPDSMGGSRGMQKVDDPGQLEKAFEYAMKYAKSGQLLIEEYVTGSECSVESITFRKKTETLAISDKTKLPPPYRVDKSVTYPSNLPPETQEDIRNVAREAVKSLGINMSPSHLELSVTAKGIRLFEVGARTGGGGVIPAIQVPAAYGVNMMAEIFSMVTGDEIHLSKRPPVGGSDLRFLTPKPGTVMAIRGLDEALKLRGVVRGSCFVNIGGTVKPVQSGGDRAGYVVTKASTREEAVRVADIAEKTIEIET